MDHNNEKITTAIGKNKNSRQLNLFFVAEASKYEDKNSKDVYKTLI